MKLALIVVCVAACSKRETSATPPPAASTTVVPAEPIPFEHPRIDDPKVQLAPSASPLERAKVTYRSGDVAGARSILEPRVLGGQPVSEEETRFLLDICGEQKDQRCIDKVHQLHP